MNPLQRLCVVLIFIVYITCVNSQLPVVLWHGMGDSCCSTGMSRMKRALEDRGIYVHSIKIGDSEEADRVNGFFYNSNDKVRLACEMIKRDERLKGGFNAIGYSQGSQFLRAYVQRCNDPPVHSLISIGGQQQGVFGMPRCPGANSTLCNMFRNMLDMGAYLGFVQNRLVQAQYWHDPYYYDRYTSSCIFLPDINNEMTVNEAYRTNLKRLRKFVMVKFLKDSMVEPRESQHFGFYKEGQAVIELKLNQTRLYHEDRLGLKEMDELGKLVFLDYDGDHLQFTLEWFQREIVAKFLLN
jgi:palmitoyl-protein thioesterase